MMKTFLVAGVLAATAAGADWSAPVEVRHDDQRCVTYRARAAGGYLSVEAVHDEGWHTYALDNRVRALEKLAGRQSTGIDRPTELKVTGLELDGPWHQTPPKDVSKPELLWFTWVFSGRAVFIAKLKGPAAGTVRISIRGQACTESTCKEISATLEVPAPDAGSGAPPAEWRGLIPVR